MLFDLCYNITCGCNMFLLSYAFAETLRIATSAFFIYVRLSHLPRGSRLLTQPNLLKFCEVYLLSSVGQIQDRLKLKPIPKNLYKDICGNKMPTRCNSGFYCRYYCLLNMFRAPLCSSSGAQEYYTVVAVCGISCCGFQVAGLVWS